MANARQDRPATAPSPRWGRGAWDALGPAVFRVAAAVIATWGALWVFNGPKVGPVEAFFLIAILAAAAVFGLITGLLAAAIAFVVYHGIGGAATPALDLRSPGTLFLALFGVGVAITGLYADRVRQRDKQARSLLEAGGTLTAHAADPAVGQAFELALLRGPVVGQAPFMVELQRVITSICIVGSGLLAAVALRDALGPTGAVLAALASVLLVAGLMGARFGLAAAVLVGILLTALSGAAPHAPMPALEGAFEVAVVTACGWGVGVLSDRLRHERAALMTLVEASRDLSAGTDEAAIRQVLLDSLSQIVSGATVRMYDEGGTMVGAVETTRVAADDPRWRSQRLAADGRDVGEVRWRFPGPDQRAGAADEIALSLIELGASAIVRTRLSVERAEMEYVARAEHLRTILLDAISHHFRSPLAGILGSVTSILGLPEQHDRSVRRQFLLIIKEQANRLSRYVDNFLSLARLESGSIEINLAEVNVESLIYDVWETFGEVGGSRRYLHVKLDDDLVRSDASLLAQVFGNILENAIKFSPEESVVNVRSRIEGARMVIEVLDQGPGVPAAGQERMFERFYRSQGAQAPGLGLGLYITRSLVEMLGGEVIARNRTDDGPGLMVQVALPLSGSSQ
jgi:two-component system sensor histidine kinase KdpD